MRSASCFEPDPLDPVSGPSSAGKLAKKTTYELWVSLPILNEGKTPPLGYTRDSGIPWRIHPGPWYNRDRDLSDNRGGLLGGIWSFGFALRPLGCSWGVRGRQFRPFPADFGGSRGGSGPVLKIYVFSSFQLAARQALSRREGICPCVVLTATWRVYIRPTSMLVVTAAICLLLRQPSATATWRVYNIRFQVAPMFVATAAICLFFLLPAAIPRRHHLPYHQF